MITAKGMFTDVTMWGIYIRFFSSRGYSFMFTNSAYEMSMGFSNIRGLTLYYFDKFLNNYLDIIYNPKNPILSVPKLPVYMSLPFMGDHSYHCKKQLSLLINKYFPQVDFRCIFVNNNIVSSFFPFKDQIPLMMSSNIIYKYSCGQCQSSYIGETHRHFISRICEHKGISPRTKKPYVNPQHSNIREHSLT